MKKVTPISGRLLIKIRCNSLGFKAIRQEGSHVSLSNGRIYVTVPVREIESAS